MHKIKSDQILILSIWKSINNFCNNKSIEDITKVIDWLKNKFNIDITIDENIVEGYTRDWSNIDGYAVGLCRPKNKIESAIVIGTFHNLKIPYTISAGRTNLTGSATPKEGFIISIDNLNEVKPFVENDMVTTSPGIYLEDMRKNVLAQTQNKFYYPVDPTSRKDARGTVFGVMHLDLYLEIRAQPDIGLKELEIVIPNGRLIKCKRGQYISMDSIFELDNQIIKLPTYNRPKIKNASGPYTCGNGDIDFIDLIIGSEGMYGLITKCTFKLKPKPKNI